MQVIYIDILFLTNTAANYLLLLASAKICDVYTLRRRIFFAALAGGVYSVFAAIPTYDYLNTLAAKALSAAVMALLTFGFRKAILRLYCVFLAVSASLGGVVYAVSLGTDGIFSPPGIRSLALSFLVSVAIIAAVFRRSGKASAETHKVHISCFGKSIELTAFVDTGNSLKDPLSGAPAIIVSTADLKPLLPGELYRLVSTLGPAEVLEALSGSAYADKFRLLPYSAVGVENSMLLALRADVKIDGKPSPQTLIALSPTNVSDGGAYSALMGI
ncbi:MAG: sigma-E processing peptidase SpoIIGA [Oscillospiraceae bacterium]|nr:sigma-E processing peptidase SpoIIGA [Oscillospiraceae bacterium]